jgi:hypothetical protein
VRHIDVFQTFAAALNTLAASAGGEEGLLSLMTNGGQGPVAAAGAAAASSSSAAQVCLFCLHVDVSLRVFDVQRVSAGVVLRVSLVH